MALPGVVALSHGPVQMTIEALRNGAGDSGAAREIAREVAAEFDRLAVYMDRLREMRAFPEPHPSLPVVLNKMIAAVAASGCDCLNTLGAVAGAFSEYAVEIGEELGCTRVIANNGGDIALYNREDRPVTVGIPLGGGAMASLAVEPDSPIRGICTSGRTGRSFSKGIATSVTVLARSAPVADACATVTANATDVQDPAILRCPAEEIDSGTDIRGQLVTVKVGALPEEKKRMAVQNGAAAARALLRSGAIVGAVLCLDGLVCKMPEDLPLIKAGG